MREVCNCSAEATDTFDEGYDYAFWTGQPRLTPVCDLCKVRRENDEPGDPDGEEMFRDFAAETRDSMDAARRLK